MTTNTKDASLEMTLRGISRNARAIYTVIRDNPGATRGLIYEETKLSHSCVRRCTAQLRRAGLLTGEGHDRRVVA